MKLSLTKESNPNYVAQFVKLGTPIVHPNADNLQKFNVEGFIVITGKNYNQGDLCVFFPVGSAINPAVLRDLNLFRDSLLNADNTKKGLFEPHGRVKAVSLRGQRSDGFLMKWEDIAAVTNCNETPETGFKYFDMIGDLKLVWKYEVVKKTSQQGNKKPIKKHSLKDTLIDGQVRLHVDTVNLRKSLSNINPNDIIGVHYKKHGTSWWVSNVLSNKKLSFWDKLLLKLGFKVDTTEYRRYYGSRKVIKSLSPENTQGFYKDDIWAEINDIVGPIPKGITLYGEAVGFLSSGGYIQKGYDYGTPPNMFDIYVYRITYTNPDGFKLEFSDKQIEEFCENYGFKYKSTFIYYGKARDMYDIPVDENWNQSFLAKLEEDHLEKDCYMCVNKVPAEGIVVRKESAFDYEAYKLKSFAFLKLEDESLDKEEENIES